MAFFVFLGCFCTYVGQFEKRPFWYFFFQKKKLLHLHENQPKLLGYQGWVEILIITLVYSKRVSVRNNLLHSVGHVTTLP
jgi:hypothetical protein